MMDGIGGTDDISARILCDVEGVLAQVQKTSLIYDPMPTVHRFVDCYVSRVDAQANGAGGGDDADAMGVSFLPIGPEGMSRHGIPHLLGQVVRALPLYVRQDRAKLIATQSEEESGTG